MLVLLIDVLLVLALELEELLLCLENLLFLDTLGLKLRLSDDLFLLTLEKYLSDHYVCCESYEGTQSCHNHID